MILDNHAAARLIALLLTVAAVASWEVYRPRRALSLSKSMRWTSNWLISGLNSVLLPLLFPLLGVGVALWAREMHFGLLNNLVLSEGLGTLLFVLLFDLAIYWQHRLYHLIPWLWRLHRMHHADPDFDVSTGIRFHPLSIIVSMLIKLGVILLLGPPPIAVLLAEIILNVTALFNHGNIYLSPRWDAKLRCIVVTPDMHRVHHSTLVDEQGCNFGFNFPWWDRLFASYRDQPKAGHVEMAIGVDGFGRSEDQRLTRLLIQPFREPRVK